MTDNNLPSRFQIGDMVYVSESPTSLRVVSVKFNEGKIVYGVGHGYYPFASDDVYDCPTVCGRVSLKSEHIDAA